MKKEGIGVFDSGLGGLTVLKKLVDVLPGEDFIYVGDTKRVPYGIREEEEIRTFAFEIVDFLKSKNVKAIVIACNTVTSLAIEDIRKAVDIPVIGVIEPGVNRALKLTENKKVGVIGTDGTINSKSYDRTFWEKSQDIDVRGVACPSFVEMVEAGNISSKAVEAAGRKYMDEFKDFDLDTLILGCTHFPVIEEGIKSLIGPVNIIDPALETAKLTRKILEEKMLINPRTTRGSQDFFVTGDSQSFREMGEKILEGKIEKLEEVEL